MKKDLPTVYCPNLRCRAANSEEDRFCHQCGEALPVRYLWATGKQAGKLPVGTLVANRFLVRAPRVLLETQPGLPANGNVEVTDQYLPYLRLFGYRLHLPELYCLVPYGEDNELIALLEGAPLCASDLLLPGDPPTEAILSSSVELATPLQGAWPQAPFISQLHWLWQIAQLWQPLNSQRVVSSLLDLRLLRVETSVLRLLELTPDIDQDLTLVDLGQTWQQGLMGTSVEMAAYLDQLCTQMIEGTIGTAEQLIAQIEVRLTQFQQTRPIKIDVATRTDTGPGRSHNEDACYPHHGTVTQNTQTTHESLVIVCDGVGGHAGGEVASQIAIAATQEALSQTELDQATPEKIVALLESAILSANEQIYKQNDSERRLDRQRMGTTLVMALVHQNQLYLAHVGDSRAYLITRSHCYQITVDDDIASREVRLGYLPYRDALRYPGSGSLIQALGMAPGSMLRPTVQRFWLDEDCIFLLCSDGLSDYERIDTLWLSEIQPLLDQKTDLVTVSKRLIDQANQLNGHDNVTVGLLHCTVGPSLSAPTLQLGQGLPMPPTMMPTTLVQPAQKKQSWLGPGLVLFFLMGGALAYLSWNWMQHNTGADPTPSIQEPLQQPDASESTLLPPPMVVGTFLEVLAPAGIDGVQMQLRSGPSFNSPRKPVRVPVGSVLQVIQSEPELTSDSATTDLSATWLEIQVCSLSNLGATSQPSATADSSAASPRTEIRRSNQPSTAQTPVPSPPQIGWIPEADLRRQVVLLNPADLDVNAQGTCSTQPSPSRG
ncbi:SpoIIE family protein phosphatase [Synechococcales cyanobacterium C]|uniref:SpoIIE family protein phosphatase n=1 Tax=Petrachloros mirabilis ULC683 TaxID=2781853 RepID=A0A8K2A7R4_9CYAN|nr:protein phosphatase 2C domain-containing protein [Petrachloros mirabilis]NCJ06474.1 SpoIIE family protein phosphatase [Petrachloros mirabilis ULC683]